MEKIRMICRSISDFYEIYVSSFLLASMLMLFCAQIFIRYILNGDTFWVNEMSIIAFGWTSIVGASYGFRKKYKYGDGHVQFTVLYDLFSPKIQRWIRIIKHIIIVLAFLYMIPPTWRTICQYHLSTTTILKLPFSFFYAPFVIFLVISIIHCLVAVVDDIIELSASNVKEDL